MTLSRNNRSLTANVSPWVFPSAGVKGDGASLVARSGVTLVELLVVMMIVTILASLTLSGLLVARSNAAIAKTSSTIRKLHEAILPFYEEYETRRPSLPDVTALLAQSGGRQKLADLRRIAIRRLMAMELPERASDAVIAATTSYTKKYDELPLTLSEKSPCARRYAALMTGKDNVTSAELLHMIVTRGPVADADIIAHFRPDEIADTDKDGLPEFVDGWRRPISFRRWPVGFASPAQPIDGTLRTIDSWVSEKGHRLVPLIFSAGPDGSYDIEPMSELNYAAFDYDPFRFDPSAATNAAGSPIRAPEDSSRIGGEVVLIPIERSGGGPLTFASARLSAAGSFESPPADTNCTPVTDAAFFTVGSERDTGSADGVSPNGVVESLDNIHNHDLLR